MIRYILSLIVACAALTAFADDTSTTAPGLAPGSRFFELRTYHAAPGKLEALNARFRDHTNKLFTKHGMTIIGFWIPMNKEGRYENTLVYILAFPDKAAHDKAWKEFSADPDWQTIKKDSEATGKLVEKVDSQFLLATDYSPIK